MNNQLIPFAYGDNLVRVIEKDGNPWWVAKDVCDVLGLGNAREALQKLDEDEKGSVRISDGTSPAGGNPNMNIINESGLYNLIFRSNKPEAKAFRKWVTSEVLPQIRKTGSFVPGQGLPEEISRELSDLSSRLKALQRALAREEAAMKKPFVDKVLRYSGSLDGLPEKYRAAAEGRRQVIMACDASGLPVKSFIKAYAAGEIVPEVRAALGPHGDIVSASSLYRWIERYEQYGVWGLVPRYVVVEIRSEEGGVA